MNGIRWQVRLHQVPLESWTFVWVDQPYGLFLSLRPDTRWRGFVLANARRNGDLLQVKWSKDLFEEHFAEFGEAELAAAQERLVELLALRIGVDVELVQPARDGRPVEPERRRVLSGAQVQQVARLQPRR
jgi:hypothetical protein